MSTVSLYDSLRFQAREDNQINLRVFPHSSKIPTDDQNLVVRTLKLIRERFDDSRHPKGMDVVLHKRIPAEGGLGGASGNAAAAIQAANSIWNLDLSKQQQTEVAAQLGSDLPFFVTGGAAICRGRGERIEALTEPAGIPVVIVTPPTGLSTPAVFSTVRIPDQNDQLSWNSREPTRFQMFNRLEQFASKLTVWINRIKKNFNLGGCIGHQLSGSGSSYFGIFNDFKSSRIASRLLKARLPTSSVYCVRTTGTLAVAKSNGAIMHQYGTSG